MADTDLILAAKATANEPARTDGQVGPLTTNLDGRLRVSSKPGIFPIQGANLVNLNDNIAVDVTDASNLVAHVKNTGTATMATGVFAFEGSLDSTNGTDGTWFGVQGVRSNSNTIETSRPTGSLAQNVGEPWSYEFSVNALKWFRIRTTTAVAASSIARWSILLGSYATEPIPAIQPHGITGTVTASISALPAGSAYGLITAATTNAAVVKAAAGNLFEIAVFNPTAAIVYVKLYNKATAPTVGTDVPIISFPVAVNAIANIEFGALGKRFTAGIAIAVTAGPLATDTAAVAAGAQVSATYI